MATSKKDDPRAQLYHREQIERALMDLEKMAAEPGPVRATKAIAMLSGPLARVRKQGHSMSDIIARLDSTLPGIRDLSPSTVMSAVKAGKKAEMEAQPSTSRASKKGGAARRRNEEGKSSSVKSNVPKDNEGMPLDDQSKVGMPGGTRVTGATN